MLLSRAYAQRFTHSSLTLTLTAIVVLLHVYSYTYLNQSFYFVDLSLGHAHVSNVCLHSVSERRVILGLAGARLPSVQHVHAKICSQARTVVWPPLELPKKHRYHQPTHNPSRHHHHTTTLIASPRLASITTNRLCFIAPTTTTPSLTYFHWYA